MNSVFRISFLVTALSVFSTVRADDESSFNTIPDASWERVEPLKGIGQDLAGFDFGNQTCRITCAAPPPEIINQLGAGASPRASLIAPTAFVDSVASVDVVSWQVPQEGLFDGSFPGVFTRIQPVTGLGKTSGFVLAIQPLQSGLGRIRIYASNNEFLLQLAQSSTFVLDPARTYRLVLSSRGEEHVGRIFDLTAPAVPLVTISAAYTSAFPSVGRCGFGVVMPHPLPADVTFDNFLAWDGTPPPLAIRQGSTPATIEVLSNTHRSMGGDLETTTHPTDPAAWLPATPLSAVSSGDSLVRVFPIDGPRAFFRGRSL
jgi:hypothetical protein